MHLAIDAREACKSPITGKGRWTEGFINAVYDKGIEVTLFTDQNPPDSLLAKWPRAHICIIHASGMMWHIRATALFVRHAADTYVSTVSYLVPCLLRGRKKCVTIVHDLIAFQPELHDWRATIIERLTLAYAAQKSNLLCTVSTSTAEDLLQRYPSLQQKVVPIFAGCDIPYSQKPLQLIGPIVSIGTLCPRKNQLTLIRAYSTLPEELKKKHPLILIGARGWSDDATIQAVKETTHVLWVGAVSDTERDSILQKASIFAFPSLYEGFGLPVLEAFCVGIPVLTSHQGSLAEVAGDAAYIVDPLDEASITHGLQELLLNPSLCDSLVQKGLQRVPMFTWEKTADLFLHAVRAIDISSTSVEA